ncbi:MAG: sulfite exporter TauE/SafE family protein [Xanthobacteraceae bacterium]
MLDDPLQVTAILGIFLFAGFIKGIVGLGLPALAVGLLSLVMAPAQAVALLTMPSIVTNIWQLAAGLHLAPLARRLWIFLLANFFATLAGLATGFLAADHSGTALAAVGSALVLYGLLGLSPLHLSVSPPAERWLSPLVGAATGLIASITGVLSIPSVPYLEAIGLRRDALVQALGLSFSVTTAALVIGLASHGILKVEVATLSLVSLVPALVGMAAGQWLRTRIHPRLFRTLFLLGLIGLGLHLLLRTWKLV